MKMSKEDRELARYAVYGKAALTPGMQHLANKILQFLEEHRAELAAMQAELDDPAQTTPSDRPKKKSNNKFGWAGMTAEERKVEMRRRMGNRKRNKPAKLEASVATDRRSTDRRSKDHPDHQQLVDNLRKARKKAWKKKSPEQKEAWMAAMRAGKAKADRARRKADRAAITQPLITMEKSA
jgi:hypothetical protein